MTYLQIHQHQHRAALDERQLRHGHQHRHCHPRRAKPGEHCRAAVARRGTAPGPDDPQTQPDGADGDSSFTRRRRTHSVAFLDNYTNLYIRDALLRVPGVGDIVALGQDFSMRVWLKPDKMAATRPQQRAKYWRPARAERAGGCRLGRAAPRSFQSQAFQYTITVNGRVNTPEEFEQMIVRTRPEDGSVVYLKRRGPAGTGAVQLLPLQSSQGDKPAYASARLPDAGQQRPRNRRRRASQPWIP